MSDRVSVSRKELEELLADEKVLCDRISRMMRRIEELEQERKQLKSALEITHASSATEASSVDQTRNALRQAVEMFERLIQETDKRIGR